MSYLLLFYVGVAVEDKCENEFVSSVAQTTKASFGNQGRQPPEGFNGGRVPCTEAFLGAHPLVGLVSLSEFGSTVWCTG
jgi:hypothetical protein